ncbi:MAG TPA: hypothetical protein VJB11_03650, partial [archaeon]|nr:hypothetical protein [archaeon]
KNTCISIVNELLERNRIGPSFCDAIENQDNKNICYYGLAEAKKDISICENIQDKSYKNSCIQNIKQA